MNEIELKARELLAEMARGFGQPEYAYHIGCGGVLDKGDMKLIAPIIAALTAQWQEILFNEDGEPTNVPADTPILVPPTKRLGMTVAKWNPLDGWETETTSEWVGMYRPTHFMALPAGPEVEG